MSSGLRAHGAGLATISLHTVLALGAAALGIGPWRSIGASYGEGWGRQLVTAQVLRWVQGHASWGHADLLAAPEGLPFWPVDPVVQALAVPIAATTDTATALLVCVVLLYASAGFGPSLLARRLGASAWTAPAAGLLVQLSPYVLNNASDVVLEVLALGPLCAAIAALHQAWSTPDRRSLVLVALSVVLLAGTSPYYAVFTALGAAVACLRRPPRRMLAVAAAGAIGGVLALGPLLLFETSPGGRLATRGSDAGYALVPGELVALEHGRPQPVRRSEQPRLQDLRLPSPLPPLRDPVPGGVAVALAGGLALTRRRSRWWALLGLGFVVLGPGPGLLARQLGWGMVPMGGVLGSLFSLVPGLSALGNPSRMLAPWILLASVGGAVAARSWPGRALCLLALLVGLRAGLPLLPLPASWVPGPLPPAAAVPAGPLSVFPSGDPPWWHPAVGPKETLWLAAQLGTPTTSDYGRSHVPIDRSLLLAAAAASGAPVARDALHMGLPEEAGHWRGIGSLLVLEDRLSPAQLARLDSWLEPQAYRVWRGSRVSLWAPHPDRAEATP